MDEDLELEQDLEEGSRPSDENGLPDSPVAQFLDEFEDTVWTGDPFRLVQRVARTSEQVLASTQSGSTGLYGLSAESSRLFAHLGRQVAESSRDVNQTRPLKFAGDPERRLGGFMSRALPSDYQSLLQKSGEFKATFFQFQQEGVVSSLLRRTDPTTLVTQRVGFTSPNADQTTAQILLGNELTYAAGSALRSPRHNVLGVQAYASFHPKVGYVGDPQKGFTAFLGTQNITPALGGNNSLETLMVFSTPGHRALVTDPSGIIEQSIAEEVYQLTNTLTRYAQNEEVYRPGALRRYLTENRSKRNFLYVEQEIYQRMAQALNTAAFNPDAKKDRVVVSMGEISILLRQSKNATQLLTAIAQLARENRLNIITDNRRMNQFYDELRVNPSLGHNRALIDLLLQTGSLRVATTGYQHDKTIAIFNPENQLKFFNVGSANMSADSLTGVNQLGENNHEYFDNALAILKRQQAGQYDPASPMNLDVNLMLGTGPYADQLRANPNVEPYLRQLTPQLYSHYTNLSAGRLQGRNLYQVGYLSERYADPTRVESLRQALSALSQRTGGLVEVSGRYDLSKGNATQVGLTVRVRPQFAGAAQAILNLSVDRYGNVIISDTNKVIPGSVFINKSQLSKEILPGRTVAPGASVQLSGIETATGLVGTIARELSFQSKYAIANELFNRLGETHFPEFSKAARNLLANTLQQSNPQLSQLPSQNLSTILTAFSNHPELRIQFESTLLNARKTLSQGEGLTSEQVAKRFGALGEVFSELTEPSNWMNDTVETLASAHLINALALDTQGTLADLKLKLVLATEEGRRQFAQIQQTQARRIVQDLTAPFLAAHELGYSSVQGQTRLPVYAESEVFGISAYDRVLSAGFLNPAEVKPGTRVGAPGAYFRPVGATSHAKKLQLPGYGQTRQLTIIDSDIATGATIAYDLPKLFQSTSGLAVLRREQLKTQLRQVYRVLGGFAQYEEESTDLFLMPFTKAEQIPQRLKNVVGTRPAVDVNPELVRKLRQLQQLRLEPDSILAGRLREALPQAQFEEVAARASQSFSSVQEYFRTLELDPLNTQRGFIGPRSMKRVAMIGGVSLIGDSSYLNADYELNAGDIHRLTVKVSSRQINNQLQTQALLSKALAPGSVVFSTPVALPDPQNQIIAALTEQLRQSQQPITTRTLQQSLESYEGGRYKNLLVQQEQGHFRLYYKEGLYTPTADGYERIGTFNSDGLITVSGLGQQQETTWGYRHQPITIKFPAFGKRHQQGMSVVINTPSIHVSDSGTIVVAADVLTTWQPGTGSRPAGAGLVKGPFSVIQSQVFDQIQQKLSDRVNTRPQALANEQLYGLFGHGHFKGFNYETGLYLLTQQDTRLTLKHSTGKDLAQSLSLLFLGDAQVKAALQSSLRADSLGFIADSLDTLKATDFAAIKDGQPTTTLGRVAMGLTTLADSAGAQDAGVGSLVSVKRTVLRALQGDSSAQSILERQTRKLISTVMTSPESAIRFPTGEVILNEGSLMARGAGLLTHLSYVGQQLFNQNLKVSHASVGNLYERDLSDAGKYLSDIGYRNTVDTVAATAGITLPAPTPNNRAAIQRKLSLLQAMIRNDVVIEDLKDITVSRSLVPTGMKDEAALEYQYLLGMSSSYLKAFTKVGGGTQASQELQQAFARLVGSFRTDLPSANAQIGYRLALPGEDSFGFQSQLSQDTQRLLLSYTKLGEDLGLLRDSIEEVTTAKGATSLRRLTRLQQIATGTLPEATEKFQARAIAANRLYGLSFFSNEDPTTSPLARSQAKHLRGVFGLDSRFAPTTSPLGLVTSMVQRAYQMYTDDRSFRKQLGHEHISFKDFVKEGFAGERASVLEERYGLITELTGDSFRIPGIPFTADAEVINNKIQERLLRLNERSLNSIENAYNSNLYKEFVHGALEVESRLQTQLQQAPNRNTRRVLEEIQNTRQVVLPQFSAEPILEGEQSGRFRVQVRDPITYEPSTGVLLGTDVLKRAPFLFPGYTDEALKYQVQLRQQLLQTESARQQLLTPGATLSEYQVRQLQQFQETLEGSRVSLVRLLDTDFTRKAMGDRQQFTGTVGIAIGSFGLDATETTLGSRYNALGESRRTLDVINTQFQLLRQAAQQKSEALPDLVRSTQSLTQALGYRQNGESLNQLFSETIEAANQKRVTAGQLHELRLHTLSALANVSMERVRTSSNQELDRLLTLSTGSIRRGGAPAGSSALTAEGNFYDVVDTQSLQARMAGEGSGLIPEEQRFKTGMLVPAVSRLLTMLGDFDGDAYQFLLTGVGDHASQLSQLQKAAFRLTKNITQVDYQLRQAQTPELLARRANLQSQFEEISTQLSDQIQTVTQYQARFDRVQNKALTDVRQWVGSYLALPDFITEDAGLSTGTLMSMVQQMSGTMPQIEDAAGHIRLAEQRLTAITQGLSGVAYDVNNPQTRDRVNQLLSENSLLSASMLEGVLSFAQQRQVGSAEDFESATRDYLAFQSNLSMTFEQVNKTLKKASGVMLNPMDFEGLQGLIGQAGTELIGKTYNVLVPLLDQTALDQSLLSSLRTTGESSFASVIDANLQQMAQEADPQEASEINKLRQKLQQSDQLGLQSQLSSRFSAVTGTLASLQQIIRDALKEKSDKGIVSVLREATYNGKSLAEALESVEADDPIDADRMRTDILKTAVMTKIGPNLSIGVDPQDYGITGFGALLKLAEFAGSRDDEDLYNRFVTEPGLENQYKSAIARGEVSTVGAFAASQVLDLVERAQASFIAGTFSESARETLVERMRQFYSDADPSSLNPTNRRIYQVIDEYEGQRQQATDNAELNQLNVRLLQDTTLVQVQARNREQNVLSVTQLQDLREQYLQTQNVRFDDGDVYSRMMVANVDTYNAYIRMLQRGQQPTAQDALYFAEYKQSAFANLVDESGNISPADQMRMARLIGLRPGSGFLDVKEQTHLALALLKRDSQGHLKGLKSLQNSTAAMTQGVFPLIDQLEEAMVSEDNDRVGQLRQQLAGLYSNDSINVDRLQQIGALPSLQNPEDTQRLAETVNEQLLKITSPTDTEDASKPRSLLQADSRLETMGIFVAPIMLAIAGSNIKLDDRVGMFALDVMQATATLSSNTERLTSQLGGSPASQAAFDFSIGRVRQSVETEGLVMGALQGLVQESLFQGISRAAYGAVDFAANKLPGGRTRAGNAMATVAAEALSTVVSLGVSRAATNQKTRAQEFVPDRIGDMLRNVSEQIWQMVEQAQLAMFDQNYEVLDTTENQNIDFEVSAIPSQFEQDVESGLTVLDEDGNPLPTEFENTASEQATIQSGISSV